MITQIAEITLIKYDHEKLKFSVHNFNLKGKSQA